MIYNQQEDDWEQSPLGSVRKAMLEFACGWHPKLPPRKFSNLTVAETAQKVNSVVLPGFCIDLVHLFSILYLS